MTKIKICGITNLKDAKFCVNSGINILGFIFAKSKRKINTTSAQKIILKLPSFISTVGVFANQDIKEVQNIAHTLNLNYLQFHGEENPDYLLNFSSQKIIKTIKVKDLNSLKEINLFPRVWAYLLDNPNPKSRYAGGTGKTFNWNYLKNFKTKKPLIFAGGLTPENVSKLILNFNPYAVDVVSGVEKSPGKKDYKKIKLFIEQVKIADLKLKTLREK